MYPETKRSFVITGASATGKSFLYQNAIASGYLPLPSHMTRTQRSGEINGIDAIFLSKEEFTKQFDNGEYLEPTLDWALLRSNMNYYGTPRILIDCLSKDGFCAMLSNILVANIIYDSFKPGDVPPAWVHLLCPDKIRVARLSQRGLSQTEIDQRITGGDSLTIPARSDFIFDTSDSNNQPSSILLKINH